MFKILRRFASTRPPLRDIIPSKKVFNRILFDQDSRLAYSRAMKIYEAVYNHIDNPNHILLPSYTRSDDLMSLKEVLSVIRKTTNTINRHLVELENELVEQAGELGSSNAIAILAFNTIQDPNTSKEDFQYANQLIENLSDLKNPLTFKLAGDLAYKKRAFSQAESYWLQFIELEPNTINASHVYSNLGLYYYTLQPKPDLIRARQYLEKSIAFGQLDSTILRSHYYYSQLFTLTDPKIARYHLEICASKGLKESFSSLGFLELNVFNNYDKSLEWFKLGHEADGDLSCLIGQFDCQILLKDRKSALKALQKIMSIQEKFEKSRQNPSVPEKYRATIASNKHLLSMFFSSRKQAIELVNTSSF
ncbi:hypothetical protein PSN45_002554 [Yamadazyma tenuis]|uniref:HCP-like protein n=1 Tax=Candida tenuis (strain ATCC 10573 / BCRC 21748 / CBS 615 / JCM 9827 / NBRC 10315 / NRRL Y-1498 / VKM Y-70) TaxID=590646 RepID=G3B026_CANTC|nr:uncharacterized protein CANTEDRAFT_102623 [Yamadazyma tenuis ATCC 10573]EGV65297.1 hypothetical protein CANTEDRAFT_102623 [Yamadazyma tenuis ATCC 10573]WEJ95045.1 hypothetical protein PSN45_002554 [Yamadazyma tenuis]